MKPLHYIRKHKLDSKDRKFSQGAFLMDFSTDFVTLLETGNGMVSYDGFANAVNSMRDKWDGINNKLIEPLPENVWGLFYKHTVIKLKNSLFPKQTAYENKKRKEYKEQQKKMRALQEEQQRRRDEWQREWEEKAERFKRFWQFLFAAYQSYQKYSRGGAFAFGGFFDGFVSPDSSYQILGLETTATKNDVAARYRELAMKHHPDKDGNQQKFVEITEAKNKIMSYLSTKELA